MELKDFYSEYKDIIGEPQDIEGVPFYPIKLFEKEKADILNTLFGRDKMEFVDKTNMPFDGIKGIYKNSYLKAMLYGYSYRSIGDYYGLIELIKKFFIDTCKIDNNNGDDIVIIGNMQLTNPLDIFNSPFYIIIKKGDKMLKIDEDIFDIIRETVLKQNGVSLKSIEGYNADMEKIKIEKYNSQKSMSFSDEIFAFIAISGIDVNSKSFKDYTLYQFKYHFGYLQQYIDYKTLYPLQASGMVKFQNKIKYYLEPLNFEKGRYDDLLIKSDDFAQSGIAKSVGAFEIPDLKNR